MSEKVIEMLDAIEAKQTAEIAKVKEEAVAKVAETEAKLEEAKVEFLEKVASLEAKVANFGAPSQIKTYKSISEEVNRSVKEQLREFEIGIAHV